VLLSFRSNRAVGQPVLSGQPSTNITTGKLENSMNKALIIAASLVLFACLSPTPMLAAKADGPKAKFFAKYDKNHNGIIDEDEKEAIRKDYAANPDGDLKRFDKNHDGKLDDEEIAAIKPPTGKKKGEKSDKTGKAAVADKAQKNAESAGITTTNTDKTAASTPTEKPAKTDKPDKTSDK
jgi:hypothetical protein